MNICARSLSTKAGRVLLSIGLFWSVAAHGAIKVACCGDSITYGVGVPDRATQSYPAVLQALLGTEFQVMRPAAGGLTLLKKGDYSYWRDHAYSGTIAAAPNVILILLGTNDSKPVNWQYGAEFEADYHALVDAYSAISTSPRILLGLPPPSYENPGGIRDSIITGEIIPKILKVAAERNLEVVDLNTPLQDKRYLMPDGIHPGVEGYQLIAGIVYDAILNGGLTQPPRPRGLRAVAGNAEVTLSWVPSAGAASYNLKRAATSGGPYETIATGVEGNSYTDAGVQNDVVHYYVVSANVSTVGESPDSDEAGAVPTAPAAPASLFAEAGNGEVRLSWPSASGAASYRIQQSTTSGGPYATVASGIEGTAFLSSGLSNGTTYHYVVTAADAAGVESPPSPEQRATPSDPPTPLGVSAAAGKGQVTVSWTPSPGATSYTIKRSTVDGGPYAIAASGVTSTSYTDLNLTFGVTYYFVVSAVGSAHASPDSAQVRAIPRVPAPPAKPTGLAAAPGDGWISLTWNASLTAASYNVKRATVSGGPYTVIASGVTATSYTHTGLTNGTTYYYVVSAVNAGGQSANSVEAAATPQPPLPEAPAGLAATAGNGQVSLSWTAVAGATGYRVKRALQGGGPYDVVATDIAYPEFNDEGLANSTTYFYVVSAMNPGGEGPDSSEVSATPLATILPSPWQSRDIGAVGLAGAVSFSTGVFTVTGAGADISGPRDAFRYVYQLASGDCSVVARVVSIQNTNANAKAGVMIRETLANNAANAAIVVTPTAGIKLQWRTVTGGGTYSGVGAAGRVAPYWVRLDRSGEVITAFHSPDGVVWTQLGPPLTIAFGSAVYVGLPVTSHTTTALCTAEFDSAVVQP